MEVAAVVAAAVVASAVVASAVVAAVAAVVAVVVVAVVVVADVVVVVVVVVAAVAVVAAAVVPVHSPDVIVPESLQNVLRPSPPFPPSSCRLGRFFSLPCSLPFCLPLSLRSPPSIHSPLAPHVLWTRSLGLEMTPIEGPPVGHFWGHF